MPSTIDGLFMGKGFNLRGELVAALMAGVSVRVVHLIATAGSLTGKSVRVDVAEADLPGSSQARGRGHEGDKGGDS